MLKLGRWLPVAVVLAVGISVGVAGVAMSSGDLPVAPAARTVPSPAPSGGNSELSMQSVPASVLSAHGIALHRPTVLAVQSEIAVVNGALAQIGRASCRERV